MEGGNNNNNHSSFNVNHDHTYYRSSTSSHRSAQIRKAQNLKDARAKQTVSERATALINDSLGHQIARARQTEPERDAIRALNTQAHRRSRNEDRNHLRASLNKVNPNSQLVNSRRRNRPNQVTIPLALDTTVRPNLNYIGKMDMQCLKCGALHFAVEKTRADAVFNSCCNFGNVSVDVFLRYPEILKKYLTSMEKKYIDFRSSIRNYNSALAMASMGAQLEELGGRGPYCFKIHGQVYHNAGPLHPKPGKAPTYGQIYVLDTDMASEERMRHAANTDCDDALMLELSTLLARKNPYAQCYFMMSEVEKQEAQKAAAENRQALPVRMIFDTTLVVDQRRYNVPVSNEVAVVFVGEDDDVPATRSLAIHSKRTGLEFIKDIDKVCDPMTYPLYFPEGGEGWHIGLQKATSGRKRTRLTQKEYYSYLLFTRVNVFNPLHHSSKLFQQYIVDSWVKIEQNRLNFDRHHQTELRMDSYKGLQDFVIGDDQSQGPPGRRIVLPSSYKGGPRDMHQSYQDAMAIVAKFGKPDYFLTMTSNPHWKEISEQLNTGQTASDRPDIIARVFDLKLRVLFDKLLKDHVLGEVLAYVAVVEFQKRGLPHCHLLLIMKSGSKPRSTSDIDKAICAELPDKDVDPELFDIISSCMVHRPCGAYNPQSPCMKDGQCTKRYPKDLREDTDMDGDSYPRYRRRNDGRTVQCGTHTGSDRAALKIVRNGDGEDIEVIDEITAHLNARYVCAPEAAHRIFGYDMQKRSDAVYRLQVHLPDEQSVTFKEGHETTVLQSENARRTNLTAFFEMNAKSERIMTSGNSSTEPDFIDSREMKYMDMPQYFTFGDHQWKPRKRGVRQLGRMYGVNPKDTERFCMRLLLLNRTGSKSFEDLRTVNGQIHTTFYEAAKSLNLLITDQYYEQCMDEAVLSQMPSQLRSLFACLITYTELKDPAELWEKYKEELAADFRYNGSSAADAIALAYYEIADKLIMSGQVLESRIQSPGRRPRMPSETYNIEDSKNEGERMYETLNNGQKQFIDAVIDSLDNIGNKLFFVDGPGGSGKTYVYTTLTHIMRGRELKTLNVAWTGIAANLLPEGRTVNSAFKINVNDGNRSSTMKRQSKEARYLMEIDCIIWDEVSMTPKCALEAVDQLLQDLMRTGTPFGGKMIILGGDFRQVLPIVNRGRQEDIIAATVKSSTLWNLFQTFTLSANMRLATGNHDWNQFLLAVGSGTNSNAEGKVELPEQIMSQGDLIDEIYGDVLNNFDSDKLTDRCILSAKNMNVNEINETVLNLIPGVQRSYLSVDEVQNDDKHSQEAEALNFPTEFLHTMTPTGMPPHILNLKEGAIIMLLRNLDVRKGLCNGTRLIVKQMGNHVLGCHHAYGDRKGQFVFIPRIDCYFDQNIPFRLRRRQFPIRLSFAMTIHKSQGQTFTKVGIDLSDQMFAHGLLYVALSRVRSMEGVKIRSTTTFVDNIVYKDVL